MRTVLLTVGTLLASANLMAASQTLSSTIVSGLQSHSNSNVIATTFPLVYGGQDISRPLIATADESLWMGQQTLIG